MGEVKIKSGNLFDGELERGSFGSAAGQEYSTNTRVRTKKNGVLLDKGTYTVTCIGSTGGMGVYAYTTESLYVKDDSVTDWTSLPLTFTLSETRLVRFVFRKTKDAAISPSDISDIQLLEGTYTSETIPEYQPYFLNRPAHQVTNGQCVDIPTHHYTNGRWQGELTSQSPLKFRADGDMLDWRVEGKTSGNLVESVTVSSDQALYGISLFLEAELKPDTLYTFAFQLAEGYFVYWNEFLFTNETPLVTGTGDTVLVVTKRTRSDLSKDNANQYRSSKGWVIHKNMKTQSSPASYNNVQILEGSYTSETIPPYEPYGGVGDWDETTQRYKIPVRVEGENLYSSTWKQGFWAYDTGSGWGTDSRYVRTAKMPCEGNTKYEFVCSLPDGAKDYGFVFWDANGNYIGNIHSSDVQNTPVKYSATSPANAKMMAINIARYSDGERHPSDILSFDLYELHETNIYADHQLLDGDSIDYATDQTAIPIAIGNNTLTVDTAVQPSKVFVKFEG